MKPQRLAALHSLVIAYELDKKMNMRILPKAEEGQIKWVGDLALERDIDRFWVIKGAVDRRHD